MNDSSIRLIKEKITRVELKKIAEERFGDMVKAVVDLEKKIMAIGEEMHVDGEQLLLDNGSRQEDLWGINLYPDVLDDNFIEFDSMINIRPRQNNRSRSVEDDNIRQRIKEVVSQLVE
jgi:hypothetical protein